MLSIITRRRMTWLGVVASVATLTYAAIVLTPWSIGPCGEDDGMQSYSPDGKHLAKVFIRSCGATTGWLAHVNLRSRWGYFHPTWQGTIRQDEVFSISCWSKVLNAAEGALMRAAASTLTFDHRLVFSPRHCNCPKDIAPNTSIGLILQANSSECFLLIEVT